MILRLWPGLAPGEVEGEVDKEQYRKPKPGSKDVLRIANVAVPTITIYSAKRSMSNGTAVIVCPGGGYNILAYEHEGTQVCNWLNELGITGVLLKYRVPRRKNRAPLTLLLCRIFSEQLELFVKTPRIGNWILRKSASSGFCRW